MNFWYICLACATAAVCAALSGCISMQSVTPYDHGYAVGTAVYAGYSRIAAKKGDGFRLKAAALWKSVNAISDTETLASDIARLAESFRTVTGDGSVTPQERAALEKLGAMVLGRVDGKLRETSLEFGDAVKFLEGVRDGVNGMVQMNAEQAQEPPTAQ